MSWVSNCCHMYILLDFLILLCPGSFFEFLFVRTMVFTLRICSFTFKSVVSSVFFFFLFYFRLVINAKVCAL